MRVAALFDVHGNLPALEAALAAAAGADVVLFGGDLAWGPMPVATVARCRAVAGARHLRGNADRELASGEAGDPVTAWCRAVLDDDALAWLGALPEAVVLDGVRYVHGSTRADDEPMDAAAAAAVAEPLIVCGHVHAPYDHVLGGRRVVGAGAVGLPFGPPGAHWLWVEDGEPRHVVTPYDTAAAGAAFREAGGPDADAFAAHVAAPPAAPPWPLTAQPRTSPRRPRRRPGR